VIEAQQDAAKGVRQGSVLHCFARRRREDAAWASVGGRHAEKMCNINITTFQLKSVQRKLLSPLDRQSRSSLAIECVVDVDRRSYGGDSTSMTHQGTFHLQTLEL
jgi:hypothetical protein